MVRGRGGGAEERVGEDGRSRWAGEGGHFLNISGEGERSPQFRIPGARIFVTYRPSLYRGRTRLLHSEARQLARHQRHSMAALYPSSPLPPVVGCRMHSPVTMTVRMLASCSLRTTWMRGTGGGGGGEVKVVRGARSAAHLIEVPVQSDSFPSLCTGSTLSPSPHTPGHCPASVGWP